MTLLSSLARRHRQPEIMDQPDLDPRRHDQALAALRRINALSRTAAVLWPPVAAFARRMAPRPVRLLDVACGAGDIAVALWRRASRARRAIAIAGCDISSQAIAHAQEQARRAGANVAFFTHDVLGPPLPEEYDIITCSLFLHHLDEGPAEELLRRLARAARLVLVSDLERSPLGYVLAWTVCRLLTRSPVVHVDGPRSVEGAFTVAEARHLAARAGLAGATLRRCWPCRYLLRWERP
jgi:2-polyprenyl-3-methyl-5-hydroxy-6-metoxy-1,4-benzoquinol methylase